MLLKRASLYCSYVTLVGAGERVFSAIRPVFVANVYICRLETAILTLELSLGT